jgi:hypothetical protein
MEWVKAIKGEKMENNYLKKCDLCGKIMASNEYGQGKCNCGWTQTNIKNPDEIEYNYNFVSFNKAKKLLKERKSLVPDFNDFLKCIDIYAEMEFLFKGKMYAAEKDDKVILFYECGSNNIQRFESIEQFGTNAKIGKTLLKDIWSMVQNIKNM